MNKNTIAAVILALASFLFFVLVLPKYNDVKLARETLKTRTDLLQSRKGEIENLTNLNRQAETRQIDLAKILVFVPARKQLDEVVASVQQVAAESGLQLTNLTTAELLNSTETRYKTLFVGLDLSGTYPLFINFLSSLEKNLRLYDITEIRASQNIGSGSANNVIFSLKMNAYYLK